MEKKLQKSVIPIYTVGISWIVYACVFPLYKTIHFIFAAVFSLAIYFIASKIFAPKEVWVDKELLSKTGNERVDALLKDANEYLVSLREYRKSIENENIKNDLLSIEDVTMKILNYIIEHPDDIPSVRRFISYYLPTTIKLLASYTELEAQKSSTPNIAGTMQKIDDMLKTVIEAFQKQHDSLYEYKAMDIDAEIHVMEDILTSEGLLEGKNDISAPEESNAITDFEKAQAEAGITLTLEPEKENIKNN